jgi:ketosteroid isomerase-like protein
MSSSSQPSPTSHAGRDEITALIHEYAARLDAGDLDGVAALFAHATIGSTRHDRRLVGAEQARTMYDDVILYDDGTPRTLHQLTNLTVHVDLDGARASARSYFTVLQAADDFPLQAILAGEYHDRFEVAADHWRFSERVFDPRLFGDLSRHMRRSSLA